MADAEIVDFLNRRRLPDAGASLVGTRGSNPDAAGRANVLARELALPADAVENNLPDVESRQQIAKARTIMGKYPVIASWAADPRNAAIARDDMDGLGKVAKTLGAYLSSTSMTPTDNRSLLGKARDVVARGLIRGARGVVGSALNYTEAQEEVDLTAGLQRRLFGGTIYDPVQRWLKSYSDFQQQGIDARPEVKTGNWYGDQAVQGLENVAPNAAAMAMAAITRNPTLPLVSMGAQTQGDAYLEARKKGLGVGGATAFAVPQTVFEVAGETLPIVKYIEDLNVGSSFFKTLGKQIVAENVGEQFTGHLQDFNEWVTFNPEKTFGEFAAERPEAALSIAVATTAAAGAQTATVETGRRTAGRVAGILGRRAKAKQAETDAAFLERLATGVAESKVAKRDPSAFARFLELQANGTPVENLYVPAAKVAEYFQSADMDWHDADSGWSFAEDFGDQVDRGLVTGGDVVLRTSDFAAHLAGTPAWEALKDHVRTSPGGMSLDEARTYAADEETRIAELGEQFAADMERDRVAQEPRQKLYQSVRDKLVTQGFTQSAASSHAELISARYAARAARLGLDLKGDEFDATEVRQVLPPGLAPIVAADQLDIAIDVLKRSRDPKKADRGASLLDFIAKQGGVEDKGGDIASMGGGDWHKGKPGKRKLIRPHADANQGVMMGAAATSSGYGLDDFAMKAWEAGYFPEFTERPDTNALLEAIDAELRGTPRYAREANGADEAMRGAVEDLEALLDQQGLDADKASKADIRKAVERYQAERSAGQGYDQADTRSEAFKRWFGDSKVVDKDGKPLVVYHGAPDARDIVGEDGAFKSFEERFGGEGDGAHWFTPSRATAATYADDRRAFDYQAAEPAIIPVYLNLENPLIVDGGGKEWREAQARGKTSDVIDEARAGGHDGVIIRNVRDDYNNGPKTKPTDTYVVFKGTQIKSVNNRGTFDPADPRILHQPAFHGSPHIFDKFSLDAIGTGEGAQVYGWGLYFAGKKEIAEFYKQSVRRNPEQMQAIGKRHGLSDDAAEMLAFQVGREFGGKSFDAWLDVIRDNSDDGLLDARSRQAISDILNNEVATADAYQEMKTPGRIYQVDIPEEGEYLLWDKPLSEQPEKVKAALEAVFATRRGLPESFLRTAELGRVYKSLNGAYPKEGEKVFRSEKDVSRALHEAGIAGIKYLDGGSRSDGDGTHNYVVFDDNAVSIRAYEQSFADGPRGRITFPAAGFGTGPSVIDLFQARDPSTFIHETGHLWLEELRADATDENAPDALKADWQTVQDWFAANGHPIVDGVIPVDAHEMWARGWERYAMEGKSPSGALRRVFDAFRSWLLQIYKVVDNLRSPITPEIREVMDRLIATDEEIEQARETQNIKALFTDAASAAKVGVVMSEQEAAAYQAQAQEARDEAFDALLYRTMAAIRQARTKAWKDEEAGVRVEVAERVDRRPEFRALAALRAKEPRLKLDRAWLVETYGEDALKLLPGAVPPIYADKGITHADVIAEMNGFRTGDEMVRTLMGVGERTRELREGGDQRSVRQVLIDEETAAIMRERHGDPLNDGSIEEEALAAIHNEKQGEIIASELRALSRRSNNQPTPYKLAREWAARTIAESRVVDSTSGAALQRYARAAAKAAKAAEEAMLKGDIDETFRQKQAQMLNNALIAEAKKAKDQIDAAVVRLGKLAKRATIKSIDQDYLDQVHQLLEQVEFRTVSQAALDERESYEAWAIAQQAAGFDIVNPPSFAAQLGKRNWSRLSVEELLGLDETVKQIVHLGRLKQKLLDAREEREFDAVVAEAVSTAAQLPPRPPSDLMEPSRWDAIKSRVASIDASLLKMETVFDWLDGGDPNGVFNRIVFRRIAEAQDAEKAMMTDYVGRLTDLLKAVPKEQLARWSERATAPELLNEETGNPWVFTRDQLVSMALNMGNEGNASKLAGGYGWNEDAIMRVLNRELSAADWTYVQGVWDTIETLWPQIAAMEKRLNGVEPEKVEARPLVTPAGEQRGGYFPVVYDPRKNLDADAQAAKNSDSLFENIYTRATTPKGFTKARTKVKRPIHLSLGIINRHVAEVIHDVTHREAIMDADRFLGDKRVMKAVDETLGPEVRKQFRPWLQHIANEWAVDRRGLAGWDAFAKKLRTNATMVGMGFRLSTIIMQAAGYSNSFERVGAKWILPHIWKGLDPRAHRFVTGRSAEVRNRMDTLERDIRENVKATLGKHDLLSDARRFAFYGIGMMDRVVVVPTWIGAYNRAVSEGMSEADAGYAADKAVRQSQGAGSAKDLAAVQRSNEFMRLVTMFYSYQSAVYQRFRTLGRDAQVARTQDLPHLIARSFWLVLLPPILSEILAGRGPDDEEDKGMWAFQRLLLGLLGPIPVGRDVANALESGFGYSFTPAARAFETGINVVGDARNIVEGEETTRATRNALEVSGYVFGLPTGQLATATQFIVDVSEGDQDPASVGDWYEGLTKGKVQDD